MMVVLGFLVLVAILAFFSIMTVFALLHGGYELSPATGRDRYYYLAAILVYVYLWWLLFSNATFTIVAN